MEKNEDVLVVQPRIMTEIVDEGKTSSPFGRIIVLMSILFILNIFTISVYERQKAQIKEDEKWLETVSVNQANSSASLSAEIDALRFENESLQNEIKEQSDIIDIYGREIEFLSNELEKVNCLIEDGYFPATLNKTRGVAYYNGHKETWYNLDMTRVVETARQRIAGYSDAEYWVREDGCKMLGNYIMVAADQTLHPYGSIVETSLGEGIVVDTGGFIFVNPYQIDIATDWKG